LAVINRRGKTHRKKEDRRGNIKAKRRNTFLEGLTKELFIRLTTNSLG